jgi:quinol---cytochrome-c reductase cytochrome c subunit
MGRNRSSSDSTTRRTDGGSPNRGVTPFLPAVVLGMVALGLLGPGVLASEHTTSTSMAHVQTDEGARVYLAECAGCHGEDGRGALEGPSVRGVPDDAVSIPSVADIVRNGYGDMDPFGDTLSETEIDAVARYVVAEFATAGDTAAGGVHYRLNCAGCHGAPGQGGALIATDENAPNLLHVPPAENVAAMRTGPGEMPAFNELALPDEEAASVTQYVEALAEHRNDGGVDLIYPGPVTEGFIALAVGLGGAVLGALWVERGGRG